MQIALLVATGLSLSACGNLKNSDLANNPTTSTTKKKSYQTTSTSKNGYNVLLKDGEYVTSPIEGTTENTSDNNVDGRALESGLINLSQNTFSSSKYVFQEGQKISVADATDWLGRKSKSNADGLNAEKSTKKDSYNPIILDQILEQDFLASAPAFPASTRGHRKPTSAGQVAGSGKRALSIPAFSAYQRIHRCFSGSERQSVTMRRAPGCWHRWRPPSGF